jgi:hypothetical protein
MGAVTPSFFPRVPLFCSGAFLLWTGNLGEQF